MSRGLLVVVAVVLPVLSGCLGPSEVEDGPPWTVHIDTRYQVCVHNHDNSRTDDGPGLCDGDRMEHPNNVTDLPNGTVARGPDLYLSAGWSRGPSYLDYGNISLDPPTWNYTRGCPKHEPWWSVRARMNRCDNTTVRQRVVVPPIPSDAEREALRDRYPGCALQNRGACPDPDTYYSEAWGAAFPLTEQGTLTLVLHRPLELTLRVGGEYPDEYKEIARTPRGCEEYNEGPYEYYDWAGEGFTWVWDMSGDVEYQDQDLYTPKGLDPSKDIFQDVSNDVVVTGDAEITLAWQGKCTGGQY